MEGEISILDVQLTDLQKLCDVIMTKNEDCFLNILESMLHRRRPKQVLRRHP